MSLGEILSLNKRMGKHLTLNEAFDLSKAEAEKYIKEHNLPQSNEVFDLRKIPEEVLDKGYVVYAPFLIAVPHNSPLYRRRQFVAEAIDYRGNVEKAKEALLRYLPISEYQFETVTVANDICVALIISYLPGNHDTIIEAMKRLGFYKTNRKNREEFLYDNKCRQWEYMVFKPCEQDDVTDIIKEEYKCLYHAAPSVKTEAILKNGIMPSNNNPEVDYNGDALFVMKGDVNDEQMQRIVNDLYYQAKQKNIPNLSPLYIIFTVDVTKLNDEVRFFLDGDEPHGLFTRKPILPNAISIFKEIEATNEGLPPMKY